MYYVSDEAAVHVESPVNLQIATKSLIASTDQCISANPNGALAFNRYYKVYNLIYLTMCSHSRGHLIAKLLTATNQLCSFTFLTSRDGSTLKILGFASDQSTKQVYLNAEILLGGEPCFPNSFLVELDAEQRCVNISAYRCKFMYGNRFKFLINGLDTPCKELLSLGNNPGPTITQIFLAEEQDVILGYGSDMVFCFCSSNCSDNGDVRVTTEASLLYFSPSEIYRGKGMLLQGHTSSISAIYVPEISLHHERRLLFTGSSDGQVIVWNMETGQQLAAFAEHTADIVAFVPFPTEVGLPPQKRVIVVSEDRSVSVIDLEDLSW